MVVVIEAAVTVRLRVVVRVVPPLVPVMVTVELPVAAEVEAVKVRVLLPVVGLGVKRALTPLGRPLAESETLPLRLVWLRMMVLTPLEPWVKVKLAGLAESEKPETAVLVRF